MKQKKRKRKSLVMKGVSFIFRLSLATAMAGLVTSLFISKRRKKKNEVKLSADDNCCE